MVWSFLKTGSQYQSILQMEQMFRKRMTMRMMMEKIMKIRSK